MPLAVALILASGHSFREDLNACVQAEVRLKAATISGSARQRIQKFTSHSDFRLQYVKPSRLLLHVTEPRQQTKAATDRTYFLTGARFVGYDRIADEVLRRSAPAAGDLSYRLQSVIGAASDPLQVLLSPHALKKFFANFSGLSGWVRSNRRGNIEWDRIVRQGKANVTAQFLFDQRTMLLKGLTVAGPDSLLEWSYQYGPPPRSLSYTPPPGAWKVDSFKDRAQPPRYESVAAKQVVNRAMAAYERIHSLAFSVSGATIWTRGNRFRQRQGSLDWSYDGGVLTLTDTARRRTFRGRAKRSRISLYVAKLGSRIDPTLKRLLQGKNPIEGLVAPDLRVRLSGSISLDGVTADIVSMRATGIEILMAVRRSDGLLAQVTDKSRDRTGKTLAVTERRFRYFSVGSVPTGALSPPVRGAVLPLPALK